MSSMFDGAYSFNQDISGWTVNRVTDMNSMFQRSRSFDRNLCSWKSKVSGQTNVEGMFFGTSCPVQSDPNQSRWCQACS